MKSKNPKSNSFSQYEDYDDKTKKKAGNKLSLRQEQIRDYDNRKLEKINLNIYKEN